MADVLNENRNQNNKVRTDTPFDVLTPLTAETSHHPFVMPILHPIQPDAVYTMYTIVIQEVIGPLTRGQDEIRMAVDTVIWMCVGGCFIA